MKRKLALIGALFLACGAMGSYAYAAAPEPQGSHASAGIVTGTVTDDKGEPVIGASVSEVGDHARHHDRCERPVLTQNHRQG